MIAGLVLKDEPGEACGVAFLDEKLETYSVETNEEIIELLEEHRPEIVAVNASDKTSIREFSKKEKELREEGHIFTPLSHDSELVKRFEALKAACQQSLGPSMPEFIRFEPRITADELAIHSDEGLNSFSLETEDIRSSDEFDSVLGAVTARFYQQEQFEDLGIIVPGNLDADKNKDDETQKA